MLIDLILVPQGAEYQAVVRGLEAWMGQCPEVLSLPIGPAAVRRRLQSQHQNGQLPNVDGQRVLLLGLGGSVSPAYQVGDVLVLKDMVSRNSVALPSDGTTTGPDAGLGDGQTAWQSYGCDRPLTDALYQHLQVSQSLSPSFQIAMKTGVTSDRLLTTAQEKQQVGQQCQASCVDMEGTSVVATMEEWGAKVSIIRVISDDCHTPIPDLTPAINAAGNLQFGSMLRIFARHPVAATNLIRGSLAGLQRLQLITTWLGQKRNSSTL
ncbi:MAG: 5'-methylthioadenosine/S-adenosylhomocysteine nucleosidase [Cyanothece sp. SIO2G6]|nr:5'-methylthioadenosine/S-adenosylhomocysteine nucleosidase [Cyanothece sp. SIO2G6]